MYSQTTGNIHNFCEVGLKIAGIVPIYSPPAITYSNNLLTSVAVSVTEQHTVGFLGNSDGHLKKVYINPRSPDIYFPVNLFFFSP